MDIHYDSMFDAGGLLLALLLQCNALNASSGLRVDTIVVILTPV